MYYGLREIKNSKNSMNVKIRVCLPRKYGRFMLFIDRCKITYIE